MKDCNHIDYCKYYHRNKECAPECSCYNSGAIVKVVRCKDCTKRIYDEWEKLYWCAECDYRCNNGEWFCAGGERKEDESQS